MMQGLSLTFFVSEIERLKNTFDPKLFSDERKELIWGYVKMLTDDSFKDIVDTFLAERPSKNPPLPTDFEKAAQNERKKIFDEKRKENIITRSERGRLDCDDCADSGVVEAKFKDGTSCVHFICVCHKNKNTCWELPLWGPEYYGEFTLMVAWPDRSQRWIPNGERPINIIIEEYKARIKISEEYWLYRKQENKNV